MLILLSPQDEFLSLLENCKLILIISSIRSKFRFYLLGLKKLDYKLKNIYDVIIIWSPK